MIALRQDAASEGGCYSWYFNLGDGTGIKVPKQQDEVDEEYELYMKAQAAPFVPRCYSIVDVLLDGEKFRGIHLQHIDGIPLCQCNGMESDRYSLWLIVVRSLQKLCGITYHDQNPYNILVVLKRKMGSTTYTPSNNSRRSCQCQGGLITLEDIKMMYLIDFTPGWAE